MFVSLCVARILGNNRCYGRELRIFPERDGLSRICHSIETIGGVATSTPSLRVSASGRRRIDAASTGPEFRAGEHDADIFQRRERLFALNRSFRQFRKLDRNRSGDFRQLDPGQTHQGAYRKDSHDLLHLLRPRQPRSSCGRLRAGVEVAASPATATKRRSADRPWRAALAA